MGVLVPRGPLRQLDLLGFTIVVHLLEAREVVTLSA